MNRVDEAFRQIDRAKFLPPEARGYESIDAPLSIGYGQTISQPTTVRMMLEWLDAQEGEKILDVGSGSGWTTALMSHIIGPSGKVYAVEKIPELVDFGRNNIKRAGTKNAQFFQAGDVYGLPQHAPFDRILVSASANELPNELLEQLKIAGKTVIPVGSDIYEVTRTKEDTYESRVHHGFIFVPLV